MSVINSICGYFGDHLVGLSGDVGESRQDKVSQKQIEDEDRILSFLGKHESILSYLRQTTEKRRNLNEQFYAKQKRMPYCDAIVCFSQVSEGLEFLHQRGVIHRSLSDRAIFWDGKSAHIGECGNTFAPGVNNYRPYENDIRYLDPGLVNKEMATAASDVWALACIIHETVTGAQLFNVERRPTYGILAHLQQLCIGSEPPKVFEKHREWIQIVRSNCEQSVTLKNLEMAYTKPDGKDEAHSLHCILGAVRAGIAWYPPRAAAIAATLRDEMYIPKCWEKPYGEIGQFVAITQLSYNTSGKVYRGKFKGSDQSIILKGYAAKKKENAEDELALLKHIGDHPNIVKFIGYVGRPFHPWLVFEDDDAQDLASQFLKRFQTMPLESARKCFHGIALAVQKVHSDGVIHGDIKPENIVLKKDGTGKLIDFGLGQCQGITDTFDVACGLPYRPPKLIFEKKVTYAVDVWALSNAIHVIVMARNLCPYPEKYQYTERVANQHYAAAQIAVLDGKIPARYKNSAFFRSLPVMTEPYTKISEIQQLYEKKFPKADPETVQCLVNAVKAGARWTPLNIEKMVECFQ